MIKSTSTYILLSGLLIAVVSPAHAWWGNNQDQRGGYNYYGQQYQGPGGYYRRDYDQGRGSNDWWHGPWNGGTWEDWRAPWSNDDSRWGSGPWDGFGDAMNNFIGEMETDLDLNMKIKAENEAKTKAKGHTREEFTGHRDRGNYYYPYYNPYYSGYGYSAPQYPYYSQQQRGAPAVTPGPTGQNQQ